LDCISIVKNSFPLTFHFLAEWRKNGSFEKIAPDIGNIYLQQGEGCKAMVAAAAAAAFCAKNSKFCKSLPSCLSFLGKRNQQ